jgi:heme/copper-type cytochrome/quinol oxidase subunit 1
MGRITSPPSRRAFQPPLALRVALLNPAVIRFFRENDYSPLVNKEGGLDMNLTPPSTAVFVISLILAALAIIGKFVAIPFISEHAFWVAVIAYVVLAVGNLFRGV